MNIALEIENTIRKKHDLPVVDAKNLNIENKKEENKKEDNKEV